MNPTIAAAAWVLLTGGPPPVAIPLPTVPQPPVLDCQLPPPPHRPPPRNHLSIRWVGSREYYDRGHHRHHRHHHRGWRFDDQR